MATGHNNLEAVLVLKCTVVKISFLHLPGITLLDSDVHSGERDQTKVSLVVVKQFLYEYSVPIHVLLQKNSVANGLHFHG